MSIDYLCTMLSIQRRKSVVSEIQPSTKCVEQSIEMQPASTIVFARQTFRRRDALNRSTPNAASIGKNRPITSSHGVRGSNGIGWSLLPELKSSAPASTIFAAPVCPPMLDDITKQVTAV